MQLSLPIAADLRLLRIREQLIGEYGPQRDEYRHDPTEQFVKAMVSSCAHDSASESAFQNLHGLLPSPETLVDADFGAVSLAIQDVTYAAEKAFNLVMAARVIRAKRGRFDLGFLAQWPVEDGLSWLMRIRGVGPKVAAATLNFSTLRKRVIVVDRHVLRLSKHLGLLPTNADFVRGFKTLMHALPTEWDADDLYELHWLMKMHGQQAAIANRKH